MDKFSSAATVGFDGGDNSLFVFGTGATVETNSNAKGNGNGAIMQLSVV